MPQAKKGLLKNHSLEKTTVLGQSTYLDLLVYVPSGDHFNLVPQYLLPVLTSSHPIIPKNKHMNPTDFPTIFYKILQKNQ